MDGPDLLARLALAGGPAFRPRGERALWLQIYDLLRRELTSGRLRPGCQLPGENQLAEAFGVTRVTLRRALRRLQQEGVLVARKGVGVFLRKPPSVYVVASDRRFGDALVGDHGTVDTRTLGLRRRKAGRTAGERLCLPVGAPTIALRRLRLLDGQPVYLTEKLFPAERFPEFEACYRERQSVAAVYAGHGIARFSRVETRVSGGFATAAEAEALGLTPATPVLRTSALNVDEAGIPIEFSSGCWPLTMVELVFRQGTG
ncbi:MAG: phosphonate metabolism transcriptional regulator PhnF [Alphaproteobacteria bacterium]